MPQHFRRKKKNKPMLELKKEDKEVKICLKYYQPLGSKVRISIEGEGDLSHHLIEGLFELLDKLSAQENCSHRGKEWKDLAESKIKARLREID